MQAEDLIFGIQTVREALLANKMFEKILINKEISRGEQFNEIWQLAKEKDVFIQKVPIEKINRITRKNHQGILGLVSAVNYMPLDNVIQMTYDEGKIPFILILDRITDVRNFGAIVRSAECAGVNGIVVPNKNSALIASEALKTSSGALSYMAICRVDNILETVSYLQDSGLQVVCITEKTDNVLYNVDFTPPTALVMGSEEDGILPHILRKSNELAKIPLMGKIESLNVSVATGVALFEVIRQRQ